MEQILNDIIEELFGDNSPGKTIVTLVFAFFSWLAIDLYRIATRKPDENGVIAPFSLKYFLFNNFADILSTIMLIVIFTFWIQEWAPSGKAIYLGGIVGFSAKGLGVFAVWIGKVSIKFFKQFVSNVAQSKD